MLDEGCSLLRAFPQDLPLRDQCHVLQAVGCCSQLWSFNPVPLLLTALPHVPTSKRDCQLRREGKTKRNIVCALGQRCQYSLWCWDMVSPWRSAARRPPVCNLAAGIYFQFICWKPPQKWQHPGDSSRAFMGVLSAWFVVALWSSDAEGTKKQPYQGYSNWQWCFQA